MEKRSEPDRAAKSEPLRGYLSLFFRIGHIPAFAKEAVLKWTRTPYGKGDENRGIETTPVFHPNDSPCFYYSTIHESNIYIEDSELYFVGPAGCAPRNENDPHRN